MTTLESILETGRQQLAAARQAAEAEYHAEAAAAARAAAARPAVTEADLARWIPPAVMEHATWTTSGGTTHVEIQVPQLAPIRADFVMTDAGLELDEYGWRVHEFCGGYPVHGIPPYWVRGEDFDASYDLAVALALAEEQAGIFAQDLAEYHRECADLAQPAAPAPAPEPADPLTYRIRQMLQTERSSAHELDRRGIGDGS